MYLRINYGLMAVRIIKQYLTTSPFDIAPQVAGQDSRGQHD